MFFPHPSFGLGSPSGLQTSFGLGGFVLVPVGPQQDQKFSTDLVHLIIDLRFKQKVLKQRQLAFTSRLNDCDAVLAVVDSTLSKEEVRLRSLESALRTVRRQRRVSP
jgi:hypothetical protein